MEKTARVKPERFACLDTAQVVGVYIRPGTPWTCEFDVWKALHERNRAGIVVCIDRPVASLLMHARTQGLDTRDYYFIDIGKSEVRVPNVVCVPDASDLTFLKIGVGALLKKISAEKPGRKYFMTIMSLSTLALYNDLKTLGVFTHALNLQMRAEGVQLLLTCEDDSVLEHVIRRFCDSVIHI